MTSCPCGLGRPYDACCGPLHRGEARAATAEALMRSRYAAYSLGEVDYLVATLHPSKRAALDRAGLAESAARTRWTGLAILSTEAGKPDDDAGIVEFEARYEAGPDAGVMHERSRFVREGGAWYYVDGDVSEGESAPAGPTRSAPCPCGSGKKFKRCCGKAA
jgi:SEC-C motif-containing protein